MPANSLMDVNGEGVSSRLERGSPGLAEGNSVIAIVEALQFRCKYSVEVNLGILIMRDQQCQLSRKVFRQRELTPQPNVGSRPVGADAG